MTAIFCLNVLVFTFLSCYKVYFLSTRFALGIVNPITISFTVIFPVLFLQVFVGPVFLLDSGINDPYYNYALFITNLALLSSLVLVIFALSICRRSTFLSNIDRFFIARRPLKRSRLILVGVISFLCFLCCFFLLTRDFGFLNWISDPRTGYQLYRIGNGHWYALSLLFLSVSYTVILVAQKRTWSTIFWCLFFCLLVYLLGSKGFILSFIVYFLTIMWFQKNRHLKFYLIIFPISGFGLMLLNFGSAVVISVLSYFDK